MAAEVRKVGSYSAQVANKAGEGARVLGALRDAGVNLVAFWGYPVGRGRARLEFVPENEASFLAAAKQAKLKLSKKRDAFCVQGDDQPGAVADVMAKLAAAKINVEAVQGASAGSGRFGAVLSMSPAGTRKAAGVLGVA